VAFEGTSGGMVEVNSETDFVARNDAFQDYVRNVTKTALAAGEDVEKLKAAAYPGGGSVADALTALIAKIGENMTLRRAAVLKVSAGAVATYVHSAAAPGLGKIGVLVALESTGDKEKLTALGRQIAMHIAATNPQALDIASVDPAMLAREKAVLTEQAAASGKAPQVIEKMVEGRVRKYYEETVLLEQVYVVDGETRIKDVIANAAKELGVPVKLAAFRRYALGEGIEKKETDFAAEVAAQLKA
jgi:elongation factor Ts